MTDQNIKGDDNRRQIILQAALDIFVEKGFAGASMSHIAKKAGVPQSLIYHYFSHKQELWMHAKTMFANQFFQDAKIQDNWDKLPVNEFMEKFVRYRFELYVKNPLIIRMMNWQRLEMDQSLSGSSSLTSTWLTPFLVHYQKDHQIDPTLDPEMMASWISSSITAPLFDRYDRYREDPSLQESYIQMVTTALLRALGWQS